MSAALNPAALSAVMRRQLWSLLGNPLGYVFILAFVLAAGATLFLFQGDKYFARNIADLGPLFTVMPLFLVVLLPALAMGAWATEREQGTEELLLTMPLSILDALLGKYLAVVTYFTIALVCSLSNVIVLAWLGTPDWGLVFANYLGWWFAGLAFAALGLLASVLVSIPAIAFVVGAIFSGIALWAAAGLDWFDAFNRGVVPLGNVSAALALVIAALGTATLLLASRRWRPSNNGQVVAQVLSLIFGLALLANLSRGAVKFGVDADVTSEGLASISDTGASILGEVQEPVLITAFISAELPNELALKGKEVIDKLKALERVHPGRIMVDIKRPKDALDALGAMASREFNLKPRKQVVDTVSGKENADVFLGAAVTSGGSTQLIDYFDPGLSVEYELIRAVRAVAAPKKKVLGIAATDLDINGGFDYQSGSMTQSWEIVNEWKKQYEVRVVNLDSAVAAEVDVLVVPQPSTLTQPQIERLHEYIWNGRAALLLEDPLPYFSAAQGRMDLIPGQPKKGGNPNAGPDAGGPQKGNIQAIYRGLGLDFDLGAVLWSDYNPSHEFAGLIPPNFVWTSSDQDGVARNNTATTGISSLLMPFPGQILIAKDKPAALTVTPLFTPTPHVTWGRDLISDMLQPSMYGGAPQLKEPKHTFSGDRNQPSPMAVEVSGTMASVFPVIDPNAKPADKKADDLKTDDKAPAAEPEKKVGVASAKPVHVIVVADVDFVNNEFFSFYRNSGGRFNEDNLKFLLNLRNVQLAANAVDALFNDKAFLELRNRRPERRPLKRLEDQLLVTQDVLRRADQTATVEAESASKTAQQSFDAELAKIDARNDIDENAKAHEKTMIQIREQRKLDLAVAAVNQAKEARMRDAKIEQRRALDGYRDRVKWLAIGVPAAVLALLVLIVFLRKVAAESAHIPTSRKRA
jgi:ABC-2 type transport system permease protein